MLSPELRTYLEGVLVKDVVGIIEEYVVGQARRVTKAYKQIVKEIVHYFHFDSPMINTYYKTIKKQTMWCRGCGGLTSIIYKRMTTKRLISAPFLEPHGTDCPRTEKFDFCKTFVKEDGIMIISKYAMAKFEFFRGTKLTLYL